jgi:hypothetical protein
MLDNLVAKMAGKYMGVRLALLEDEEMPTKPWYKSKTMWSDVATIALALVGFVDKYKYAGAISASPWYSTALTFLGGLGIYGRATADTTLSK